MDSGNFVARARASIGTPKTEWPSIAEEPATVRGLYLNYIMILAALPPVFTFIKSSIIGYSAFGIHVRVGLGVGVGSMVLSWILALIGIYLVSLIVNALARSFGGQPDRVQALKTLAYAYTAFWIASVGHIIPWIGWLVMIAGSLYSIYLLYLGLPHTMKCPPEKAAGYTAVTMICTLILYTIIMVIAGAIIGVGSRAVVDVGSGGNSAHVTVDKDSTLGRLQAFAQSIKAVGGEMAATNGGAPAASGKAGVAAVSTDRLKTFLPDSLDGLSRSSLSASSNTMGVHIAEVAANYGENGSGHHLRLVITDLGSASGMLAMAHLAGNSEKHTSHGFEKTWQQNGNVVQEKWDGRNHHGEYSTTVADRFSVELSGQAASMDDIQRAVAHLDLKALAALKNRDRRR